MAHEDEEPCTTGDGLQVTEPLPPGAEPVTAGPRKWAVAVTGAPPSVMVQALAVPVQPPVQPVKVSPARAIAVSVTCDPSR